MRNKIKEKVNFIRQFIREPKSVGAVFPSSKYTVRRVISFINFNTKNLRIVEYGAGTGPFTREIVKSLKSGDVFIVIEQNEKFVNILNEQFGSNPLVKIYHDSVENISAILEKEDLNNLDYIISGIPLSVLSKKQIDEILESTKESMHQKTLFLVFQYSILKINTFKKHFTILKRQMILRNFPFVSVFCMQKKIKSS